MLSFIHKHQPLLAWLLLALLLFMCLTLPFLFQRGQINTSILALLPDNPEQGVPEQLQQELISQLDRQLIWLINSHQNTAAAAAWQQVLSTLPQLTSIRGALDANEQNQWLNYLQLHAPALLDDQTLLRLEQGAEHYARWVLSQFYSPFAGVSLRELQQDPLLLARSLHGASTSGQKFELQQDWPVVRDESGGAWYLLQAELNISSYSIQQAQELTQELKQAKAQWLKDWPDSEILERGTLFYSSHASEQAQKDMRTLGSLTLLGVVLLIFLTFRSLLPLVLCVLSITAGVLSGVWAVLLVFGELHLLTLVMSVSVVGVTVDYVLYYLVERRTHGAERSPNQSLSVTFPTLFSALLTTLLAYLLLALPPLPVFRQLAVFSVVGMIMAFLVVLLWLPLLTARLAVRPLPATAGLKCWLALWQQSFVRFTVPSLILLLALFGLLRLHISDDPADFQNLPLTVQQQEQRLAKLLGQPLEQTWLLVFAAHPQAALEKLEKLEPLLKEAVTQEYLEGYQRLPLISLRQQHQQTALLETIQPQVTQILHRAGLLQASTTEMVWQTLTPEHWLTSPPGRIWGSLLLNTTGGLTGLLLPLEGIANSTTLQQQLAGLDGVALMDRRSSYTQVFTQYRQLLTGLLLFALLLLTLYLVLLLGIKAGLRTLLPTLLSLLAAPAALGGLGYSFNLFALLAMLLVLGVGINYTLFFSNPKGTPATALFATFLAASTTLLTLGILVFSSTQAISSFGLVLGTGLLVAFLLSPLATPPPSEPQSSL